MPWPPMPDYEPKHVHIAGLYTRACIYCGVEIRQIETNDLLSEIEEKDEWIDE